MFLVSSELLRSLLAHQRLGRPIGNGYDRLYGTRVEVSSMLPMRSKVPVSKDRFCEYSPRDMAWAEPLGLARWELETIHMIEVDDGVSGKFIDLDTIRF